MQEVAYSSFLNLLKCGFPPLHSWQLPEVTLWSILPTLYERINANIPRCQEKFKPKLSVQKSFIRNLRSESRMLDVGEIDTGAQSYKTYRRLFKRLAPIT